MDEPEILSGVFALQIDDTTAGYFLGCSGIRAEYETYPYGEGGLNTFVHQLQGRKRYGNITLTRGVTSDKKLLEWFMKPKERESRGSVTINLLNNDLTSVQTWAFAAAWVVRYSGPEMSAASSGQAIETLEIAHEGLVPGVG
jgi:phage tail-like protein